MKSFNEFLNEGIFNFKKNKQAKKELMNEFDSGKKIAIDILKYIHTKHDLKHLEGEFKPIYHISNDDYMGNKNPTIIIDAFGMSISYDTVKKQYKVLIPVKFNKSVFNDTNEYIKNNYNIIKSKGKGFTTSITFKK